MSLFSLRSCQSASFSLRIMLLKKQKQPILFIQLEEDLTARQNGLALAGDFMSASTFLGLIGAFALTGYDAFFLMYGALVSFLVILFLVAEPLRNLGKYTLGDMVTVSL